MARVHPRGNYRAVWCASIANIAAPTAAEIAAGTLLSDQLRPDAVELPLSGNTVDASDVGSALNKLAPSTYGGDKCVFHFALDRTTTTADAKKAVLVPIGPAAPQGTAGFFIERRIGGSTAAIIATHRVSVFPMTVVSAFDKPLGDEIYMYDVETAITADVAREVAVV
jgi:hypothetical protein